MMVMASCTLGITVLHLSRPLKPAIRSCGQAERFNSVRFLTPACAGAGACQPRDSSRATEWPGVSHDWGPLRYTWEHHSVRSLLKQSKSIGLHGYVSVPSKQIRRRYQSLDGAQRGKLRLNQVRTLIAGLN